MANYNLVVNSKFQPFSFDELLKPALMATQAHRELEDQYAELATKANVWEGMANEQTDPYAYNMYKTYSEDLRNQADVLAKEGLNPTSRQGMLNMKARYSSDIVPIEQAYKRRQELIDEQRKLSAQDNTLMFDTRASQMSLDDLIRNPQTSYQSYSGAALAKQVGTAASNLAKNMRENPREWRNILGNQYYESMMQTGFSPEAVMDAVQNNPNAAKELTNLVEGAIDSSGIKNWNNTEILNRAYDYARQGLWNAVGETKYQTLSNKEYDFNQQLALANAKKKGLDSSNSRLSFRPIGKTKVKEDIDTTKLNESIELVNKIKNNPELLKQSGGKTLVVSPSITGGGVFETKVGSESYRDKWEKLTKRYNTKNPDEVIKYLKNDIAGSALRSFDYISNYTDNSKLSSTIQNSLQATSKNGIVLAFEEKEDGSKGDRISKDDLEKISGSEGFIKYDAENNTLSYQYTKGKDQGSIIIDPEILDDKSRTLSTISKNIELAKNKRDYIRMAEFIDDYTSYLDGIFNTQAKIQSNTDSNLEIGWLNR